MIYKLLSFQKSQQLIFSLLRYRQLAPIRHHGLPTFAFKVSDHLAQVDQVGIMNTAKVLVVKAFFNIFQGFGNHQGPCLDAVYSCIIAIAFKVNNILLVYDFITV